MQYFGRPRVESLRVQLPFRRPFLFAPFPFLPPPWPFLLLSFPFKAPPAGPAGRQAFYVFYAQIWWPSDNDMQSIFCLIQNPNTFQIHVNSTRWWGLTVITGKARLGRRPTGVAHSKITRVRVLSWPLPVLPSLHFLTVTKSCHEISHEMWRKSSFRCRGSSK